MNVQKVIVRDLLLQMISDWMCSDFNMNVQTLKVRELE